MNSNAVKFRNNDSKLKLENDLEILYSLTAQDLICISKLIGKTVPITPILNLSSAFGQKGTNISVKLESKTPSGSFKVRGATYYINKASELFGNDVPHLFAASTGNHGISLAKLAKEHGYHLTIVVPSSTPLFKKHSISKHSATLVCAGDCLDDSLEIAKAMANEQRGLFVDSAHHLLIMGHTSLSVELFQQVDPIDYLFFPIGVGSGISASCIARNLLSPNTKIIGVIPEKCPAWYVSRMEKRPTLSIPRQTAAVGLRTAQPNFDIFKLVNSNLDDLITVSETEILDTQKAYNDINVECETTGSVGLAGLLKFNKQQNLTDKHLATVLCSGGNLIRDIPFNS